MVGCLCQSACLTPWVLVCLESTRFVLRPIWIRIWSFVTLLVYWCTTCSSILCVCPLRLVSLCLYLCLSISPYLYSACLSFYQHASIVLTQQTFTRSSYEHSLISLSSASRTASGYDEHPPSASQPKHLSYATLDVSGYPSFVIPSPTRCHQATVQLRPLQTVSLL